MSISITKLELEVLQQLKKRWKSSNVISRGKKNLNQGSSHVADIMPRMRILLQAEPELTGISTEMCELQKDRDRENLIVEESKEKSV